MAHRHRRPRRTALGLLGSALLTAAAVVGVTAVLTAAGGAVFGVHPVIVVSGSMEPTLPVGAMVFTRDAPAGSVRPGDIVTVPRQDGGTGLITHRVVTASTDGGITTLHLKGDANATEDPVAYRLRQVGEFVLAVPVAGTVALAARTPLGVTVIGVYFAALMAAMIFGRARRAPAPGQAVATRVALCASDSWGADP